MANNISLQAKYERLVLENQREKRQAEAEVRRLKFHHETSKFTTTTTSSD